MLPSAVKTYPSCAGLIEGPNIGSRPANSCCSVIAYHPTVDTTFWMPVIETFTTSSMGYGNDQCRPGPSKARSPSPTGLPKRKMIARSCGPTVKKPDPKNTSTKITITSLMMPKLLRNASDSACEPASIDVSGPYRPSGASFIVGSSLLMLAYLADRFVETPPNRNKSNGGEIGRAHV